MKKICILLCLILLMGGASASIAVRMDDGAALLDANGAEIVPFGVFDDIVPLKERLFAAGSDGKFFLINGDGKKLSDAAFEYVRFADGLLLGRIDGLWCTLDENGNILSESAYTIIVPSLNGSAWAIRGVNGDVQSDELLLIQPDGVEIPTGQFVRRLSDTSGDGLIAVLSPEHNLYGYCDAVGNMRIPPRYDTAGTFRNGLAAVSEGGKNGVINGEGQYVLPPEYDFADPSGAGFILAAVRGEGAYVFAPDGTLIAEYIGGNVSVSAVGSGYMVCDDDVLRLYNASGQLLHTLANDAAVYPGLNGQMIFSEGAWGEQCVRLSDAGQAYQNLIPMGYAGGMPVYAFMQVNVARYMNNLLGEVQLSADMDSARYGLTDDRGEMILPASYISMDYLQDDRFLVRTENQWRMIDAEGWVYWQRNIPEITSD